MKSKKTTMKKARAKVKQSKLGPRYTGGSAAREGAKIFRGQPVGFEEINTRLISGTRYDTDTLVKEYSYLRAIGEKRLIRMKGHEEAEDVVKRHGGHFLTVPEIKKRTKSEEDFRKTLVYNMIELKGFLLAERGSLSGIHRVQKKTADTLNETLADSGADIKISAKEVAAWGKFIDLMKEALGLHAGEYDVKYVADTFSELKLKGTVTKKDVARALEDIRQHEEKARRTTKVTAAAAVIKGMDIDDIF